MPTHELKTIDPHFKNLVIGKKTFELRKNDRDFKEGDKLKLRQYDAVKKKYSGCYIDATIIHLLEGFEGVSIGYCILGIKINKIYLGTIL